MCTLIDMASILALQTPVHVLRGCRSHQRPGVAICSKINVQAPDLPSQPTNGQSQMRTPSPPPTSITAAEYTQANMATSWRPLPDMHGRFEDTRLVMMFSTRDQRARQNNVDRDDIDQTPFIFVPCQLDISICEELSGESGHSSSGHEKLECVGLPGDFVRGFLSGPLPLWHGVPVRDGLGAAHFDDDHPWVFSRCIMEGFSGMGSEEAAVLSRDGLLGCWASVTLTRQASGRWDLGFLIHRLVVSGDH